jgi:integrase
MAQLLDRYLSEHVENHNAETTRKDILALLEKHVKPRIGSIKANDFTRADAARLHTAMKETPRRANYALSVLSKALALAEIWGLRPENSNPCGSIRRYPENHRTRFLSMDEVTRLGDALVEAETEGLPWRIEEDKAGSKHLPKDDKRRTRLSWQAVAAVRLLLLTGARLNEIITLKWSDVDMAAGTIALPCRKGGRREPHPASAAVLAILASLPRPKGASHVLPRDSDPKKPISKEVMEAAWQRLRWRVSIEDVRLHDLRHTIGTYAAQAGVSSFIVRDLLRHRNITTTARYANFDAKPVRQVANTLGEMLSASLEGQAGGTVVPLIKKSS